MSSNNLVVEVPQLQWPKLRDLYLINWPTHMIGYYTIDNYIQWINKRLMIKYLFIYSLNGDWSDGTFVVIDRNQLTLNTLSESNERLTNLLSLLDWSHGFTISTLRKRCHSAVLDVIESKKLKTIFDEETLLYYMSKEESFKLDIKIPEEVTIGNLSLEHVSIANSVWPFRSPKSVHFLQTLAELNTNVCLTTNIGKLIAWCFRLPSGPLGALQVDENYKRKGFGYLTVKLMAKKLAEIGHDTCACVVLKNVASHEMFKKVGFKVVDNIFFIGIEETVPFDFN